MKSEGQWGLMDKNDKERVTSNLSFAAGPVQDYLVELHRSISQIQGGKVADYIPELGKSDPGLFGIALATVDGKLYTTGNAEHAFTIQSVSKPFMYGYALEEHGRDFVLRHVGVEPTGEAFNSIVLDALPPALAWSTEEWGEPGEESSRG